MASYFALDLDTTGPLITVAINSYTLQGVECDITVLSNELPSSEAQDIYIIDAAGKKHNMILAISADGMSYTGTTNFNDCAAGIATVYAQLQDDVGNVSNLASAAINILAASVYYCDGDIKAANIRTSFTTSSIDTGIEHGRHSAHILSSLTAADISTGSGKISIEKAVV